MTAGLRGQPAGRPGRVWLRRRQAVATRGAGVLEEKLRILVAEEQGVALRADRAGLAWQDAVRELDRWSTRAALLAGRTGLRPGTAGRRSEVDVDWRLTMGVRYPVAATCRVVADVAAPAGSAAVLQAAAAAGRAVRAAAEEAVARTALAAVRAEIATTRRQLRAVTLRWMPRMAAAEAALAVALEDQEREEQLRLRWAAATSRRRRSPS